MIHHDPGRFIPGRQGWFNISKSVSEIYYINRTKDKNHLVFSIMQEKKVFAKIQHLFMIKTLNKLGIEENYLNITKGIYEKPIVNIILDDEKLKVFPLRSGTKQGCLLLPVLLHLILETLARAIQ